jgi:hypothetical protein
MNTKVESENIDSVCCMCKSEEPNYVSNCGHEFHEICLREHLK